MSEEPEDSNAEIDERSSEPNESPISKEESDEGMASIDIQDEELAREYKKERKQARYITYAILFLFLCVVIYVGYLMLTKGTVFDLDVVNQFIELLREMFET